MYEELKVPPFATIFKMSPVHIVGVEGVNVIAEGIAFTVTAVTADVQPLLSV